MDWHPSYTLMVARIAIRCAGMQSCLSAMESDAHAVRQILQETLGPELMNRLNAALMMREDNEGPPFWGPDPETPITRFLTLADLLTALNTICAPDPEVTDTTSILDLIDEGMEVRTA